MPTSALIARAPWLGRVLVLVATIALAGCVEYRERMVLERGGGGTVDMRIDINEALARATDLSDSSAYEEGALTRAINTIHGLTVTSSSTRSEGTTRSMHIAFTFDSIAALNALDQLSRYRGLFGRIDESEDADGNLVFSRTVRVDRIVGAGGDTIPLVLAPVLGNYEWTYELTLPSKILESNGAGDEDIENPQVALWRIPLGTLVKAPALMKARHARTGIGPAGIGVAVALMLILTAGISILQKRRRTRTVDAA